MATVPVYVDPGGTKLHIASGGVVQYDDTVSTAAIFAGGGTAASPVSTSTAGLNFQGFWTKSTATSGTSRGLYVRHYLAGAGGAADGEALRAFTTIDGNTASAGVHGAHISLSFANSGNISGEGAALRATLQVPNANLTGTTAALYSELYADGASSAITGNTSFLRAVLGGNATGAAAIEDSAALIRLEGGTIAAGNIAAEKTAAAVSHTLRINLFGTTYYLMVSDTQ